MNKTTAATAAIAPRAKTSGMTQFTPPLVRSGVSSRLISSYNSSEDSGLLSDMEDSRMDSSGRDDSAGSGGSAAAELSLAADEGFSCSALLSAGGWDAGLEAVWAGLEVSAGFEEGSAGLDDSAGLEGSGLLSSGMEGSGWDTWLG